MLYKKSSVANNYKLSGSPSHYDFSKLCLGQTEVRAQSLQTDGTAPDGMADRQGSKSNTT